MTSNKLKYFSK